MNTEKTPFTRQKKNAAAKKEEEALQEKRKRKTPPDDSIEKAPKSSKKKLNFGNGSKEENPPKKKKTDLKKADPKKEPKKEPKEELKKEPKKEPKEELKEEPKEEDSDDGFDEMGLRRLPSPNRGPAWNLRSKRRLRFTEEESKSHAEEVRKLRQMYREKVGPDWRRYVRCLGGSSSDEEEEEKVRNKVPLPPGATGSYIRYHLVDNGNDIVGVREYY